MLPSRAHFSISSAYGPVSVPMYFTSAFRATSMARLTSPSMIRTLGPTVERFLADPLTTPRGGEAAAASKTSQ